MKKMYVRGYFPASESLNFFCLVANGAEATGIARGFVPPLSAEDWYIEGDEEEIAGHNAPSVGERGILPRLC